MKTFLTVLILIVLIGGIGWWMKNNNSEPVTTPEPQIIQTPDEREVVETYLRENITTLSPIAPVLGGSWYVVSVSIDTEANAGTVTYEDGHIQEKRNFTYIYATGEVQTLDMQ